MSATGDRGRVTRELHQNTPQIDRRKYELTMRTRYIAAEESQDLKPRVKIH